MIEETKKLETMTIEQLQGSLNLTRRNTRRRRRSPNKSSRCNKRRRKEVKEMKEAYKIEVEVQPEDDFDVKIMDNVQIY